MATSKKALEIANFLHQEFAVRMAALSTPVTVAAVAFDTDANPYIQLGTGGIGAAGGIVKVAPITWALAKDALGLNQDVFTPHSIQICLEANPAGGGGADINSFENLSAILCTVAVRGTRVEVYSTANGVAPVTASLTAGNLRYTFDNDLWHGLVSNQ